MKTTSYFGSHHRVIHWQKKHTAKKTLARLRQSITSSLSKLKEHLGNLHTDSEPKIWQKKDSKGNLYYRVYDPICDRYFALIRKQKSDGGWINVTIFKRTSRIKIYCQSPH
jgi:coproporphyrinogen III oxidase